MICSYKHNIQVHCANCHFEYYMYAYWVWGVFSVLHPWNNSPCQLVWQISVDCNLIQLYEMSVWWYKTGTPIICAMPDDWYMYIVNTLSSWLYIRIYNMVNLLLHKKHKGNIKSMLLCHYIIVLFNDPTHN